MEGIGKAWEGAWRRLGEGRTRRGNFGDRSGDGLGREGAHMPIRRFGDIVQHLVGPVRGSSASAMFGVAAESGGNQRMEWVFMARRTWLGTGEFL